MKNNLDCLELKDKYGVKGVNLYILLTCWNDKENLKQMKKNPHESLPQDQLKRNFNESIQVSTFSSAVPSTALSLLEGINKQVDSVQYQLAADCQ